MTKPIQPRSRCRRGTCGSTWLRAMATSRAWIRRRSFAWRGSTRRSCGWTRASAGLSTRPRPRSTGPGLEPHGAGLRRDVAAEIVLPPGIFFLYVALGTLGVVAVGSLYKTAALAKGGSAVAESLGGRLVNPDTTHPDERKLRNVIEEMAIAAGVPVPKIHVLADEEGINAFAAGHAPGDAAIGVTRGCMTLLDRDELQGIIGHEFSHILNGDMLFGNCLGKPFLGALATHPPLDERIRAIDPGWVGTFKSANLKAVEREAEHPDASAGSLDDPIPPLVKDAEGLTVESRPEPL